MTGSYEEFLDGKRPRQVLGGFEPDGLADGLYPFQRDIVTWACRHGKAATFDFPEVS